MKEKIWKAVENWNEALNAKEKDMAGLVNENVKMVRPKGDVKEASPFLLIQIPKFIGCKTNPLLK